MSQESKDGEDLALAQIRFEYAWRYFALHAKQRVTMFSFFLLGSGIIANAYGLLLREQLHWQAGGVATIGLLVAVVSCMLEKRNHTLVDLGEDALLRIEKDYLSPLGNLTVNDKSPEYMILSHEREVGEPPRWQKHGALIQTLEVVVALGFAVAAARSFCIAVVN